MFPEEIPRNVPCVVRFLFTLGAIATLAVSTALAQTNTFEEIEKKAQALSIRPFQPLDRQIPDAAARMSYSEYRAIAFDRDKAIWNNTNLKFRIETFFRAFLYPEKIQINIVGRNGAVQPIAYSSQLFKVMEGSGKVPKVSPDYGFAGMRLLYEFPYPRSWEELVVFQGASYFRFPAPGQVFGLSARGIAINTADPKAPEEFPAFSELWVVEPEEGAKEVTVYALLDGPSVTGAYQFIIKPLARTTEAEVKATLFFRQQAERVGYAPITSMFWYGENNYRKFSDYRPEVHDSDGLLILDSYGTRIWRPLQTVTKDLVDIFALPKSPQGFGLLQRDREYSSSVDIRAIYHRRPSLWVEPIGDWNDGSIILWQIPTVDEYHDNVVAYWMPKNPPKGGEKHTIRYRLTSTAQDPPGVSTEGQVKATYIMSSYGRKDEYIVMVDFAWNGDTPAPFAEGQVPGVDITVDNAKVLSHSVDPNPDGKSWRLYTDVKFPSENMNAVLRYRLKGPKGWNSEEWTYTFVPQE